MNVNMHKQRLLAGFNDEAYIRILKENEEWKEHAIQIDRHIREFEKGNRSEQFKSTWLTWMREGRKSEPQTAAPTISTTPSNDSGSRGGQVYAGTGQPMDIDRSRGSGYRGPPICYNCNKPGHLAHDCREPRKPHGPQRIREFLANVTDQDRKILMEELRIEKAGEGEDIESKKDFPNSTE